MIDTNSWHDKRWDTVTSFKIKSSRLAFAGDNVVLSSNFIANEAGDYIFQCKARNNEGQEFTNALLKLNRCLMISCQSDALGQLKVAVCKAWLVRSIFRVIDSDCSTLPALPSEFCKAFSVALMASGFPPSNHIWCQTSWVFCKQLICVCSCVVCLSCYSPIELHAQLDPLIDFVILLLIM